MIQLCVTRDEHRGRALQGGALHVVVHAADAAEFLAAAGAARSAMDHVRHRRAVAGLLLGAVAVDQHEAAVEGADAEDEIGRRGGIVGVEGGHEAAVAAIGERDGLIEPVIAHHRADRAEGLDAVHVGGADRVRAVQEQRRKEGAALAVRALDREVVGIADDDVRFAPQLRHLRAARRGADRGRRPVPCGRSRVRGLPTLILESRSPRAAITAGTCAFGAMARRMAVHFCPAFTVISFTTSSR